MPRAVGHVRVTAQGLGHLVLARVAVLGRACCGRRSGRVAGTSRQADALRAVQLAVPRRECEDPARPMETKSCSAFSKDSPISRMTMRLTRAAEPWKCSTCK